MDLENGSLLAQMITAEVDWVVEYGSQWILTQYAYGTVVPTKLTKQKGVSE